MQMYYQWVSVTHGFCEQSGNRERKENESDKKSRIKERGGGIRERQPVFAALQTSPAGHCPSFKNG